MNTQHQLPFPVYELRPLPNSGKWLRWNNGDPIPDDGEYDVAFLSDGYGAPIVIYVSLPYHTNLLWSWAKDGQWAAFVSQHPSGNAWHYMTTNNKSFEGDWNRDKHPNVLASNKAMSWQSSKRGCSNGRSASFHINDEYITTGLLRNAETKEVVKFPEIFNCCYCGKHDWKKEEENI